MALNFIENQTNELSPRITVFGVGGAGGNAVNNMIEKNLEGVEFVVANTDAQALQQSKSRARVQLGVRVTEGLGAGARPSVGASAAEETLEEIVDHLAGAHMCFITAGMGGGTGTGAAPIIAQAARELGVLTVGVVTKPFAFEGAKRMRQAEEGVEALQKVVDTLIIIPNQNLFRLANEKTTFTEAFAMADDVLYQGVKGVTDLMVRPGMINLDFADVRAVMDEMGKAMMGTGEAEGEDRARQAAEKAIANPLLDEISLNGAKGVLINITGGYDMTLFELDEAANIIRDKVDPDANIIVGSTLDPEMEGAIRVSVVATGIEAQADALTLDVPRRKLSEPLVPVTQAEQAHQPEPRHEPRPQMQPEMRPEPRHEPRHAPAAQAAPAASVPPEPMRERPAARPAAGYHRPQPAADPRPVAQEPEVYENYAPEPVQDELDLHHHHAHQAAIARVRENVQRPAAPQPRVQPAPVAEGQPRTPGTPSPETLARLREAVSRQPAQGYQRRAPEPPQHPQHAGERSSRFGLGALINKMAGTGAEATAPRHQPPVSSYDEDPEMREAEDRIEIPAFLRRQAN
ncbi:cell division protein FtsZ [Pararhodobacter sp. SW119]|uniref:cell division protein FtsZ n=1 Tax=Pararhodobacter sp. SW119 TaxID=2780075 RepID=UPI001AE074FA|nr:cell division protein FtsZ [Pararhodobacter sp. SW119]